MACSQCWALSEPPPKKSYLVHLSNDKGESHKIIVQTICTHDMQEWVDSQIFPIANPKVIYIDDQSAAHIPIVALN